PRRCRTGRHDWEGDTGKSIVDRRKSTVDSLSRESSVQPLGLSPIVLCRFHPPQIVFNLFVVRRELERLLELRNGVWYFFLKRQSHAEHFIGAGVGRGEGDRLGGFFLGSCRIVAV